MHPDFCLFGTPQTSLELVILSLRLLSAGSTDLLLHAQFTVFKSVQWVNFLILTVSVMDIDPLHKISVDLFHLCTCFSLTT